MYCSTSIKKPRFSPWNIRFLNVNEQEALDVEGHDPLIVLAKISSFEVKSILVEIDSSVDILTVYTFYKLGFKDAKLKKANPVYGFANQPIIVKGSVILSVFLGDMEYMLKKIVEFLVVHHPTAYNPIFEELIMKLTKMVVATFYMVVKFPMPTNEGYMKCDQKTAYECHIASL
ncbi:hypothetical protein J1N35_008069 [Gossypium stocksii]|uniref:Uncharacterized protein n=1 Tax=Gossypium stocksii TaxID=47602 RepID=A0A9D4AGA2_9ROSI|nr:hypothetical protein J1N35_008069 [Gossypium stocksii]